MERTRQYHCLTGLSLKEKRAAVKLHKRYSNDLRQCFVFTSGEVFEGYVMEIERDRLLFDAAVGPMGSYPAEPFYLGITGIDLIIYYSDDFEAAPDVKGWPPSVIKGRISQIDPRRSTPKRRLVVRRV